MPHILRAILTALAISLTVAGAGCPGKIDTGNPVTPPPPPTEVDPGEVDPNYSEDMLCVPAVAGGGSPSP